MEIEMFCPRHLHDEKWEVPDSYRYFKGELPCTPGPGETPETLKVWFIRGFLVDVAKKE
jgi:hypothetical protein